MSDFLCPGIRSEPVVSRSLPVPAGFSAKSRELLGVGRSKPCRTGGAVGTSGTLDPQTIYEDFSRDAKGIPTCWGHRHAIHAVSKSTGLGTAVFKEPAERALLWSGLVVTYHFSHNIITPVEVCKFELYEVLKLSKFEISATSTHTQSIGQCKLELYQNLLFRTESGP